MKSIFLDTNIWIRVIVKDNEQMFQEAIKIFQAAEQGKVKILTSGIILLEVIFVLKRLYKFTKIELQDVIKNILDTRGIRIIDKTDTKVALEYFLETGIKFSDCLIASQIPENAIFCSFDTDFQRFKNLSFMHPKELNTKLKLD